MAVFTQVLCSMIVCYLCMSMGIMFTWPSSTVVLFGSENTTLDRPMTETELALFGSLSSVGAIISTPLSGYAMDRIGRKWTAVVTSFTHVISWTLILAGSQVELVLAAVFISGFGGGAFLTAPVMIGEICQESIRGAMAAASMVFYSVGMLESYLIGGYLSYRIMLYVCVSISVGGVVLLSIIRESPVYLLMKGLDDDAAKSMAFYRGVKPDSKVVQEELNSIRSSLNPEMDGGGDDDSPEQKMLKKEKKSEKEQLSPIQFFRKSGSTRRAFMVLMVLITTSIFQGLAVVQVYAEPLFKEAVPTMSSTISSVILAISTILASVCSAYLSEVLGRKSLMIYCSLGAGLCCILLGSQIQLQWGPHALTAIGINVYCIITMVGPGTVPYVLVAEVFLPEIRSIISSIVIEWAWVCNFIVLLLFNPLVDIMGLGPLFYIFAIVCFGTAVFSVFFLPETKGRSIEHIQVMFTSKKKRPKTDVY